MKDALFKKTFKAFFFTSVIFFSSVSVFSQDQNLNPITYLKQSQSLNEVRDFMTQVREDLESYFLIYDHPIKSGSDVECFERSKSEVLKSVSKAIFLTLKLYPDEELPVDEALSDLKGYLKEATYMECVSTKKLTNKKIENHVFSSKSGRFFIRLDFFSPLDSSKE